MRQAELRLHFRNEAADEYLKMKLTTTRHVASDWARVTLPTRGYENKLL